MNWYVHGITQRKMTEDDDRCKHLKVGEVAPRYTAECDSFGRETYYMCESCYEALQTRISKEGVTCDDCSGTFPRKETREWKWYDFDYRQGDEALCICDNCASLPRHLNRLEIDRADFTREFPELAS